LSRLHFFAREAGLHCDIFELQEIFPCVYR